jgi:iron-sulfur cluster insertion protein
MPENAAVYPERLSDREIRVTDAAREMFAELQGNAEDDVTAIRLFVSGGGCGGMTYGMTYADKVNEFDSVLQGANFTLVVDAVALGYLQGCEIDFTKQGLNASFVFNNVFQSVGGKGTCGGCGGGNSF